MRIKTRNASILKLFILVVLQFSFIVHTDTLGSTGTYCGVPKVARPLIFGGSEISKGAYPWNAALELNNGGLFCGATLISSTAVVTAANCMKGKQNSHDFKTSDFKIILGLHNVSQKHEIGRLTLSAKKIHIHPDWNVESASFFADIAVLELEEPVEFTNYIQPICLLKPQSAAMTIKQTTIVGYGFTEGSREPDIARQIQSPIQSCTGIDELNDIISARTFCSGNANGTGVCSGDAGNGIYVYYNQQFYLRGIVSAALYNPIQGCDLNTYSVSTDVPKFYNWLQNLNIQDNKIEADESMDCGKMNRRLPLIIRAEEFVRKNEFSWNAALIWNNGTQFCGGTLISKKFVLTASHCVLAKGEDYRFNAGDFVVVLGAHDLSKSHEVGKLTAAVLKIHIHPDWNIHTSAYDADIALLELEHEVPITNYIKPICVPKPLSDAAALTRGIVVGFGETEEGKPSSIARKLGIPIVGYHECSVGEDHKYLVTSKTFCGGKANGSGACRGDSGSGVYVIHNGRYYIRGIVSLALLNDLLGCNVHTYSIFTDVVEFYAWIKSGGKNKYFTGFTGVGF